MAITSSQQVTEWLAQPNSERKPASVMLAIEGYIDASAGVKQFTPRGKPMFILGIGRNDGLERAAKEALEGLHIPVRRCEGGTITVDITTKEQLESIEATGKFRSARLSSERAINY